MEEGRGLSLDTRNNNMEEAAVHKHTRMSLKDFRSMSMNATPTKKVRLKTSKDRAARPHQVESNNSLDSLGSQGSTGASLDVIDSPKIKGSRFYKAVQLGRGTMSLLDKWKSHSKEVEEADVEEDLVPMARGRKATVTEKDENSTDSPTTVTKKSSWSEHVWSTFIHRGFSDDVTEQKVEVKGKDLLT